MCNHRHHQHHQQCNHDHYQDHLAGETVRKIRGWTNCPPLSSDLAPGLGGISQILPPCHLSHHHLSYITKPLVIISIRLFITFLKMSECTSGVSPVIFRCNAMESNCSPNYTWRARQCVAGFCFSKREAPCLQ